MTRTTHIEGGTYGPFIGGLTTMTINTPSTDDLLIYGTNLDHMYDKFCKRALLDRYEWNTLDASNGAGTWVSLAGQVLNWFHRDVGEFRRTVADRLRLALALSDYYTTHLDECTPSERRLMASRLGLGGLTINTAGSGHPNMRGAV